MAERDDDAQEAVRAAIEHLESAVAGNPVSILDLMDPMIVERETDLFSTKFLSECMDVVTPDMDPEAFGPTLVREFRDFRLAYETRKRLEGDCQTADLVSCFTMINLVPTIRVRVGSVAGVVRESDAMLSAMRKYRVILRSIPIPLVETSQAGA